MFEILNASLILKSVTQNPVKNALLGSLVRTLLIQVQKTKVSCSDQRPSILARSYRIIDRSLPLSAFAGPPPPLTTTHLRIRRRSAERAHSLWTSRLAA